MVDEIQILKKTNKTLKEERDLALEQSSSSSQLRNQEIIKLKEKIAKLSSENADFDQRNTMLSTDLKNTKEMYEDAKSEKVIATATTTTTTTTTTSITATNILTTGPTTATTINTTSIMITITTKI